MKMFHANIGDGFKNICKLTPFGPFFHLPTLPSILKHFSLQSDFFIKYGYKMLELKIKCMRFENI
jgi:hypothetical protein